jgi:hypothetical protein
MKLVSARSVASETQDKVQGNGSQSGLMGNPEGANNMFLKNVDMV